MQVKKLGYVLFVGVIAAVCILPAAVMPWQEENAVGNEQLAPFPELRKEDGNFNTGILNDFADYFAGHFGFHLRRLTATVCCWERIAGCFIKAPLRTILVQIFLQPDRAMRLLMRWG